MRSVAGRGLGTRSLAASVSTAALVLTMLVPATAAAAPIRQVGAGARVTVANMTFSPSRVTVAVGETVTWTFSDITSHTATSDQGFFNTGQASSGQQRSVRFRSAGTYAYHCILHPHMTGRVRVPVTVAGTAADGWRLTWLVGDNPRGRTYDVQVRRKGATRWKSFRSDTTKASGRYDPGSGTWQVRARTTKGAKATGWSPVVTFS